MILCDTNVLIEFYKDNAVIIDAFRQIGFDEISISVITQAELYHGALNAKELEAIRKHLSLISIVPIDEAVSIRFIELMKRYSLSHKLAIPDALIAATSIEYGQPLVTLNTKDFRFIEGLQLFPA